MPEYIEREGTIEFIRLNYCKDCNSYNGIMCRACSFDDAMLAIEDVPAADVVEVVRCKDCKHYKAYPKPVEDFDGLCVVRECETDETEFCSYGYRRRKK